MVSVIDFLEDRLGGFYTFLSCASLSCLGRHSSAIPTAMRVPRRREWPRAGCWALYLARAVLDLWADDDEL